MRYMEKIKCHMLDMLRPVLSDRQIMKYNQKGVLIETPIKDAQLQPNSVDLTLADSWKTLVGNVPFIGETRRIDDAGTVDTHKEIKYINGTFAVDENGEKYYAIKPKQFILMASNEVLNIPNGIIAFVQGRSSVARLAIQTEQAGLIDAGFHGTITFEVFNQSDATIKLYAGTRIAQVYFFKAQHANKLYGVEKSSKYNGQIEATGSKIHLDKK